MFVDGDCRLWTLTEDANRIVVYEKGQSTGNYSFITRVIDRGTPGTNDQFGLKLIDRLGQVVTGFTFNPVTLGGGNNLVPKK